jgi:hypothetical protein
MATIEDRVDSGLIGTISVVGGIAVLVIALAMNALVRSETDQNLDSKGTAANLRAVQELKTQQQAALREPARYTDRERGRIALPVDRAMVLVVDELRKNPLMATPVAPAANGGAAADGGPAADGGAATGKAPAPGKAPAAGKAPPGKGKAPAPPAPAGG